MPSSSMKREVSMLFSSHIAASPPDGTGLGEYLPLPHKYALRWSRTSKNFFLRLDIADFRSPESPTYRRSRRPTTPGLHASSSSGHRKRSRQSPPLLPYPPGAVSIVLAFRKASLRVANRQIVYSTTSSPCIRQNKDKATATIYNFFSISIFYFTTLGVI